MKKYKLLYFLSEDHYFLSHKLPHALKALKSGFDVLIVCKESRYREKILSYGFKFENINLDRKSLNPFKEFLTILSFFKIIKRFKPDIIQNIALKPILYGSFCSIFQRKIKIQINAIVGLGYLFINKTLFNFFVKTILKFLLKFLFFDKKNIIVFQNKDDLDLFLKKKIVNKPQSKLIPSSGVNIKTFKPSKIEKKFDLIMHSRMLVDKGVMDLIKAIKILKKKNFDIKVLLLGNPDNNNRASIKIEDLKKWKSEKLILWKSAKINVIKYINQSRIGILPSYREGFPKSLLESASCGLPLISTNVPGCKDICINNYNGLTVDIKNPSQLSEAIRNLITNEKMINHMGSNSRKLVIKKYSDQIISSEFLKLYRILK